MFGIGCGGTSIFCPKMISEYSYKSLTGSTGSLVNTAMCFGTIITGMIIALSPEGLELVDMKNGGAKAKLILFINFSIPIFIAVLQIITLRLFFPYESPVTMKQNNEYEKLEEALSKIYHPKLIP